MNQACLISTPSQWQAVYADNISSSFLVPRVLLSVPQRLDGNGDRVASVLQGVAKTPKTTLVFHIGQCRQNGRCQHCMVLYTVPD